MEDTEYMLTTEDNPYDPFENFDEWYAWDQTHGWHIKPDGSIGTGYKTCAYLDRVADVSYDLSAAQITHARNTAIDEIIAMNLTGNYKKVAAPRTTIQVDDDMASS